VQRRERACAEGVPQELQGPRGDGCLRHYRRHPGLRNNVDLWDCFQEVYHYGIGLENGQIPNDPELPLPFDRVHPINEVVRIDYFLPGCPPSADAIWKFITDLAAGREPKLDYEMLHYD